ncbi:hypothetical protein KIN20_031081 [Parelaphostrongylus tenuis]|uniref:Uncharacterized protein n=1 Tax=Parelaphostrongylus tenuis TaxID=148309 RepID=A0AAD5WGS0_PARTN|nr:hypothetical protein KIN20_031081 [Parelaphostrongylus tenuis]
MPRSTHVLYVGDIVCKLLTIRSALEVQSVRKYGHQIAVGNEAPVSSYRYSSMAPSLGPAEPLKLYSSMKGSTPSNKSPQSDDGYLDPTMKWNAAVLLRPCGASSCSICLNVTHLKYIAKKSIYYGYLIQGFDKANTVRLTNIRLAFQRLPFRADDSSRLPTVVRPLRHISSHLTNTSDAPDRLRNANANDVYVMESFDVTALYTVSNDSALQDTHELLIQHQEAVNMYGLSIEQYMVL